MALKLITDAVTEPVTRAEAALFLRYTGDLQNDVLDSLIVAATRYVQNWCNTQLINATFEYYTDSFCDEIPISIGPISSFTMLEYQDSDDVAQTLASTVYGVDLISPVNKVYLKEGQTWPITRNNPNAVKMTFVAGYGANNSDVPEHYKTVIKMVVSDLFEHRNANEEIEYKPNPAVKQMLNLGTQNYRF